MTSRCSHSGGSTSGRLWERKDSVDFLIATPAAGATFYINAHDGAKSATAFLNPKFLPAITRSFALNARANRGRLRVSMGGYGALHLAFRHPELFLSFRERTQAALIVTLLHFSAAAAHRISPRPGCSAGLSGNPPNPISGSQFSHRHPRTVFVQVREHFISTARRRRLWL